MSDIWACYSVYQDAENMRKSLSSIINFVDKVVVVDGVFRDHVFYNNKPYSTDDTLKVVKSIVPSKKLTLIESERNGWEDQSSKRNRYLGIVPRGDWIFSIDSDEVAYGDMKSGFDEVRVSRGLCYGVLVEDRRYEWDGKVIEIPERLWHKLSATNTFNYSPRFIKSTGNLKCMYHHSLIYDVVLKVMVTVRVSDMLNLGNYTKLFRIVNDRTSESWRKAVDGYNYRVKRGIPL